jgi:chromosome segregation ATPase
VIAAALAHERAGEQMPGLVGTVSDTRRRVDALMRRKPALADEVTAAEGLVRHHTRRRDDAAELLRVAGLSTTIDGPVPTEDEGAIRERLASVEEALANAAVDPELHEQLQRTRRHLSNLDAQLDADPDRRRRAERFAASDGARHPIALAESVESATQQEAHAREEYARARATADRTEEEYERLVEDRSSDRSSPDLDGIPAAGLVATVDDADRFAEQLDALAPSCSPRSGPRNAWPRRQMIQLGPPSSPQRWSTHR